MECGGRIVNFSSSVIGLAMPGYAVYAATKSAIETMTNILSKELRDRYITVNAVAPGPTATSLFVTGKLQEVIDRLAEAAPLEHLGQPGDIADTVSMLEGPDGGWINNQTLRANGGLVRGPRARIERASWGGRRAGQPPAIKAARSINNL